jgi:tetratricopeptide (TPR) repeat protein
MVCRMNGRLPWLVACVAVFALAIALSVAAQSTGMVKGVVKDMQGQPVDGAKVVIEMSEGTSRRFETKSNKKGEFIQIGLPSGAYKVTAEKDKQTSNTQDVRVRVNSTAEAMLVLGAPGAAAASKEATAKNAELRTTLEAGLAASQAGNDDEAIAKFSHAVELKPDCADCYYNIGFLQTKKKDYDKAEVAYKKAIELKPDYADAYNGLANIYNAQKKFDLAAAASVKAGELAGSAPGALVGGGGGNADALFNQGVILWNAGKIPDAKKQFEGAIAANPNHAEAHYQLGMALVNEGNLPGAATEFETYLKLAPSGPNAATAKGILGTIKK